MAWVFPHQGEAVPVGSRLEGDEARVWLLTRQRVSYWIDSGNGPPTRWDGDGMTSDPPPWQEAEARCKREAGGLWRRLDGSAGFAPDTPSAIEERAGALRAERG